MSWENNNLNTSSKQLFPFPSFIMIKMGNVKKKKRKETKMK